MNRKDDAPQNPEEKFRKHLQDMLQNANVSFMFGPQQAPPAEAGGGQKAEGGEDARKRDEALRRIREFSLKPHDIRDYLDRFVIKQQDAKKVLAVAICDHYNHVRRSLEDPVYREKDYAKHNIMLLGPSGVGKTYLVRCIAKLIGVPFVKADATKFSETGYVGHDVEDMVRDLVRAADGDTELAGYGIIYLDEVDKIAGSPQTGGKDVSGRGVQVNLLKLMEETDVSLHSQTDLISQVQAVMDLQRGKQHKRTINTRHMLFIVSGAFDNLSDLVRQRVASSQIGFSQADREKREDADYLKLAETRDFVKYGFEPEFVGRLPIRVVCERLNARDLEEIMLKSEGSVLSQYKDDFAGYGIDLSVSNDAVSAVAAIAEKENTGARGLMTVLERIMRDFKFELPSTPARSLELSAQAVADPAAALGEVLSRSVSARDGAVKAEIREFADKFESEHGFKLKFTPGAVQAIADLGGSSGKNARVLCAELFHDFQHGLALVARNTGRNAFTITRKTVSAPGRELSQMIADSFAGRSGSGTDE